MNRILIETIEAMLSDFKLPKRFWAEALSTATYIRNQSLTNVVPNQLNNIGQMLSISCNM